MLIFMMERICGWMFDYGCFGDDFVLIFGIGFYVR